MALKFRLSPDLTPKFKWSLKLLQHLTHDELIDSFPNLHISTFQNLYQMI